MFRNLGAALLALTLAACQGGSAGAEVQVERGRLGLFSSLPIYWGAGEDLAAMLDSSRQAGWVRQSIERRAVIVPLDALERDHLAGVDTLVIAQPRPLAPSENVALDEWVRGGGRLLLFADPMLTRHSDFALGDKRRPQDIVLLSPILARWGLELHFDEGQAPGERTVAVGDRSVPVELAGAFTQHAGGEAAHCALLADGLMARCTIGKGRATLIADAALLDDGTESTVDPARRAALLDSLLAESLGI